MRIWIAFLFISFLVGARLARRGRDGRTIWMLATCVAVALLLNLERFG